MYDIHKSFRKIDVDYVSAELLLHWLSVASWSRHCPEIHRKPVSCLAEQKTSR